MEGATLPRLGRTFTDEELVQVRKMQTAGRPRQEIANSIGLCTATYAWHLQQGKFGELPKQQGRRHPEKQQTDNPETGMLFSCPENEWRKRQLQVRDGWPESELERRAAGKLPNVIDNYAKFKRDNPNIKPEQPGRKQQWPRTY